MMMCGQFPSRAMTLSRSIVSVLPTMSASSRGRCCTRRAHQGQLNWPNMTDACPASWSIVGARGRSVYLLDPVRHVQCIESAKESGRAGWEGGRASD